MEIPQPRTLLRTLTGPYRRYHSGQIRELFGNFSPTIFSRFCYLRFEFTHVLVEKRFHVQAVASQNRKSTQLLTSHAYSAK